jgi:carbon-monoxide dehydrogenase medium subunit
MGVADRAVRATAAEAALAGQAADADTVAAAAREATKDLEPASDMHGSAGFRRHLAGVAVRRALTTAAGRAGGSS